jgi:hypothetical protein
MKLSIAIIALAMTLNGIDSALADACTDRCDRSCDNPVGGSGDPAVVTRLCKNTQSYKDCVSSCKSIVIDSPGDCAMRQTKGGCDSTFSADKRKCSENYGNDANKLQVCLHAAGDKAGRCTAACKPKEPTFGTISE